MEAADRKLLDDELRRCDLLSAGVPPLDPRCGLQPGWPDARYHRERARVLRKIDPRAAVAFIREDALNALQGARPGRISRWAQLHRLEKGQPIAPVKTAEGDLLALMAEGVEAIHRMGRTRYVTEALREARASRPPCDICGRRECDGCFT